MTIDDIEDVINLEKTHRIKILNSTLLSDDLKQNNNYYVIAKLEDKIVGYIGISYVLDSADIIDRKSVV